MEYKYDTIEKVKDALGRGRFWDIHSHNVSPSITGDKNHVLYLCKIEKFFFSYASDELKHDIDVLSELMRHNSKFYYEFDEAMQKEIDKRFKVFRYEGSCEGETSNGFPKLVGTYRVHHGELDDFHNGSEYVEENGNTWRRIKYHQTKGDGWSAAIHFSMYEKVIK